MKVRQKNAIPLLFLLLRCSRGLVQCQLVMGILDSLVGQQPLGSSLLDKADKCQCRKPIQFLTPSLADIVLKGKCEYVYKLRASLNTCHDGNIAICTIVQQGQKRKAF